MNNNQWTILTVLLFIFCAAGCIQVSNDHDHDHGPDGHAHDEEVSDTAGTYADTTAVEAEPAGEYE